MKIDRSIVCRHAVDGGCWDCRHPVLGNILNTVLICAFLLALAWLLSGRAVRFE